MWKGEIVRMWKGDSCPSLCNVNLEAFMCQQKST